MPLNEHAVAAIIFAILAVAIIMLIVDNASLKKRLKTAEDGRLYVSGEDMYCEFDKELNEICDSEYVTLKVVTVRKEKTHEI